MAVSLSINEKNLTSAQVSMMSQLENYDMSFVFDKLIIDDKISECDVPQLEIEFKKFIALAGLKIYPIAMISPLVDEVWHQFILFTKHYKEFCQNTVGFFVGHMPDTPKTPIPVAAGENLRMGYKKFFGNIHDIWYKGMDEETKAYYMQPKLIGKPPKMWSGWAGHE